MALEGIARILYAPVVTDTVEFRLIGSGFYQLDEQLGWLPRPHVAGQHPYNGTRVPFHTTSRGFSGPSGQALPTLGLPRVAVLTSANTCSASESIVNGLRGVGVQVLEVGSTTCGKPYGFYPQDNCGTTYFSIQFQSVNDQGFGDYPDGFSPANATGTIGVAVPGCAVADGMPAPGGDASPVTSAPSQQELAVRSALETVMDPEINLSVIDLGLIREIRFLDPPKTLIRMMLTTPFCPYAPQLMADVKQAAQSVVSQDCEVELMPDPWSPDLMPDPGLLGFSY